GHAVFLKRINAPSTLRRGAEATLHNASIVRPDGEGPLMAADEVGVEVGHAQVVDALALPRGRHSLHDDLRTLRRQEPVALHQLLCREPSLAHYPEWVLRGCADH